MYPFSSWLKVRHKTFLKTDSPKSLQSISMNIHSEIRRSDQLVNHRSIFKMWWGSGWVRTKPSYPSSHMVSQNQFEFHLQAKRDRKLEPRRRRPFGRQLGSGRTARPRSAGKRGRARAAPPYPSRGVPVAGPSARSRRSWNRAVRPPVSVRSCRHSSWSRWATWRAASRKGRPCPTA